jgi:hypothetical protein
MSTLYKTNLFLQGAPLPQNFKGTPQQWYESILERTRIVAPFGFSTIVVGGLKPTSNQGPWLKDGITWYVWDDNAADYIPLVITDSETPPYWVQADDPAGTKDVNGNYLTEIEGGPADGPLEGGPLLWFRLDAALTQMTGIFLFVGGDWQPLLRTAGTTADRPTNPASLEQYYDTTISTMLHFERGQWRTVDGCRGDLKYVSWATAEEALQYNPGWEIYGTGETESVTSRGRILVQATKNPGAGPTTQLTTAGGVNERAALEASGEEEHTLTSDEIPAHDHANGSFNRILKADGTGTSDGFDNHPTEPNVQTSSTLVSVGSDQPHNNLPPVYAVWCIRKT